MLGTSVKRRHIIRRPILPSTCFPPHVKLKLVAESSVRAQRSHAVPNSLYSVSAGAVGAAVVTLALLTVVDEPYSEGLAGASPAVVSGEFAVSKLVMVVASADGARLLNVELLIKVLEELLAKLLVGLTGELQGKKLGELLVSKLLGEESDGGSDEVTDEGTDEETVEETDKGTEVKPGGIYVEGLEVTKLDMESDKLELDDGSTTVDSVLGFITVGSASLCSVPAAGGSPEREAKSEDVVSEAWTSPIAAKDWLERTSPADAPAPCCLSLVAAGVWLPPAVAWPVVEASGSSRGKHRCAVTPASVGTHTASTLASEPPVVSSDAKVKDLAVLSRSAQKLINIICRIPPGRHRLYVGPRTADRYF